MTATMTCCRRESSEEPATPTDDPGDAPDGGPRAARARPHVVILGAGFAGLHAARALARADVSVTLIDRRNHHLFQPLLYQVATAGLAPTEIAYPIRAALRGQRNVRVLLGEAIAVDAATRRVRLEGEAIEYDYLIVATGARHSYFAHPEWESAAPGLKSLEDALEIRRRVLTAFERAEREHDPARRQAWLTFVVVGGGPTGVELAGAIAELACSVLRREFHAIDTRCARVLLVEAGPRVLPSFPASLSARAEAALRARCVDVRTGAPVRGVSHGAVLVGGEHVAAETVLWAAGVEASPLARTLGVSLDAAGRVQVAPDLSVPGHPEILVVGDAAALRDAEGRPLPGTAPVAIRQGRHAARVIRDRIAGRTPAPYVHRSRGSLATIGRGHAVLAMGGLRLSGVLAWWVWLVVHVWPLIGFRSRLAVMLQWAWAYTTWERSARVILHPPAATSPAPLPRAAA